MKLMICAMLMVVAVGCQQGTQTAVTQTPVQDTNVMPATRQYEKTAGPVINIQASNVPPSTTQPAEATQGAVTKATATDVSEGVNHLSTGAGLVVYQFNTINIGNQTPTQTGTTTGTGTATQTPTQTSSLTPTQTVTPEFTTAVPISVGMPGSAVSGTANAAGSGGTLSNPTTTASQTPTYTLLKVPADYTGKAIDFLTQIFDILKAGKTPVVTSQPQ